MSIKNFNFRNQAFSTNKILVIGNFDGIHKGHQTLFKKASEISSEQNLNWGVFTFYPHTYNVIHGNDVHINLSSMRQKIQTIRENGGSFISVAKFNKNFANLSSENFVKQLVKANPHIEYIIVGKNYRFAKNRCADVKTLIEECLIYNIKVIALDLLMDSNLEEKKKHSSSHLRYFLKNKQPEKIKEYTGKYFEIIGRVKHGDKRGRTINFPTINVSFGTYAELKYGVYLVEIQFLGEDQVYYGMSNVGIRPTYKLQKPLIETNIFHFNRDVYGKRVAIRFMHFIREEKKFNSLSQLKQAIESDKSKAKKLLATS